MTRYSGILLAALISLAISAKEQLFETRFADIGKPSWGLHLQKMDSTKDPYFFIVVPTYNNEQLCIENIQSIIKQTYPHWRLHIVDDCSSDKTFDLLTRYVGQLPQELQHKIGHKQPWRCTLFHVPHHRVPWSWYHTFYGQNVLYRLRGKDLII